MPDLRKDPPQRNIKQDAALEGANQTKEEVSNQARGHKANLSNPSPYRLFVGCLFIPY